MDVIPGVIVIELILSSSSICSKIDGPGMVIFVICLHPEKTYFPNVMLHDRMCISFMLVQFLKPLSLIIVILSGSVIIFKLIHELNALSLIDVTLLGIVIVLKLKQYSNAELPIDVTESGIVILLNLEHPQNAPSKIDVTDSKISKEPDIPPGHDKKI